MRQTNRLIWLLAISLVSAGSLTAHALGFRIAGAGHEQALLDRTGHAYLPALPDLLLASGVCALVLALAIALSAARRALRGSLAPPAVAAAAAPLAFALQEHLERLLAGQNAIATSLEPAFLVGLALQLPFALVGLWLARRLTGLALAIATVLQAPRRSRPRPSTIRLAVVAVVTSHRFGSAEMPRGPPLAR